MRLSMLCGVEGLTSEGGGRRSCCFRRASSLDIARKQLRQLFSSAIKDKYISLQLQYLSEIY